MTPNTEPFKLNFILLGRKGLSLLGKISSKNINQLIATRR